MPAKKLMKIETLISQIEKLQTQHAKLKEELSVEIVKLLNKKNAMSHDFETLVGAIISAIETLKKDDDTSMQKHKKWKKIGANYFGQKKKSNASSDAVAL